MEGRGEAEHARGGNARHPRRMREGTASEGKKASSPRPHAIKLYVGVSRLTAAPTVNCGDHRAPRCFDCPNGCNLGASCPASWCNGECRWVENWGCSA